MKKSFKRIFIILTLLSMLVLLASCKEDDSTDAAATGNTVVLNVYNWGEYISDGFQGSMDTNAEFEKYFNETLSSKYGGIKVKVNYTTYDTNENMYSKLSSGAGSYDIVIPSDYMIQKMIANDMLLAFDATTLSNYGNISDEFKGENAYYDPENLYSVPYTYGMLGVIYNTALVDEVDYKDKSWGLLWNDKYKGKILQFNNPRDAFGSAMYYGDLDINSKDTAVWDKALDSLVKQKPLLQGYVNDEIFNKMTTASASIAPYFAGDFLIMASQNEDLSFYYPKEGTNYFVDAMCILKDSKNPEIAKEYINFMLTEAPAVANAIYIGYASPNKLVVKNPQYQEEMSLLHEDWYDILYGLSPSEANKNYSYPPSYESFTPEIQSYVNTLWESLKTENSTELWVHISCGIIVAGVLALAIYTIYTKKKRSRDYRMRDKMLAKSKNK